MPQPETNGSRFADMAADPTVAGEIIRNGDTIQSLKIYLNSAARIVVVRDLLTALVDVLQPNTDGGRDLGAAAKRFAVGYLQRLIVRHPTDHTMIFLVAEDAQPARLVFRQVVAGEARATLEVRMTSDAARNLEIQRYNDAGALLGAPIIINRATGLVTLENGLALMAGNITLAALATVDGRDVSVDGAKLDCFKSSLETPADVVMTDASTWYNLASKTVTVPALSTRKFLIAGAFSVSGTLLAPVTCSLKLLEDATEICTYPIGQLANCSVAVTTLRSITNATGAPVDYVLKMQGLCNLAGKTAAVIRLTIASLGADAL